MKIHIISLACAAQFALVGCTTSVEKTNVSTHSKIAASEENEAELKKQLADFDKLEEQRLKDEKENVTTLQFNKIEHDFGTVKPESDNYYQFKITNTGNKPLIINNTEASCGCTMPKKPEGPIMPNQSDYIEVKFKPFAGQTGEIRKTITVSANIPDGKVECYIKAFVKE